MLSFNGVENFQLILLFYCSGTSIFVRSFKIYHRPQPVTNREHTCFYCPLTRLLLSDIFFIEQALAVQKPWLARALVLILLLLVGPAAFGFVLGISAQKEWGAWLANRLGFSVVHVIPAAWDWRFSRIARPGIFIMVTLTTGETVVGLFGSNSFASSDIGERDLYIEEEYMINEHGASKLDPRRLAFLSRRGKSGTLNSGDTTELQRAQMANKPSSTSPARQIAQDGHRPQLLTEGHKPQVVSIPRKVQGGYEGPSGGGKPAAPTTGSGVKPAVPPGGKK